MAMKITEANCPNCGAHLRVDTGSTTAVCDHCGSTLLVDDGAVHVKYDNAEQAGYEFEKGRQRAWREQAGQQPVYVQVQSMQQPKKRRTWLWVLGWIFIFPVPLTLVMLNNESVKKGLSPMIRYAIIVIGWLLYFAIAAGGGGGQSAKSVESVSTGSATASAATAATSSSTSSHPGLPSAAEFILDMIESDRL